MKQLCLNICLSSYLAFLIEIPRRNEVLSKNRFRKLDNAEKVKFRVIQHHGPRFPPSRNTAWEFIDKSVHHLTPAVHKKAIHS